MYNRLFIFYLIAAFHSFAYGSSENTLHNCLASSDNETPSLREQVRQNSVFNHKPECVQVSDNETPTMLEQVRHGSILDRILRINPKKKIFALIDTIKEEALKKNSLEAHGIPKIDLSDLLFECAKKGNIKKAKELPLLPNQDNSFFYDEACEIALVYAILNKHSDFANYLIGYGVVLDIFKYKLDDIFRSACSHRNFELATSMLKARIALNNETKNKIQDYFYSAVKRKQATFLHTLLQNGLLSFVDENNIDKILKLLERYNRSYDMQNFICWFRLYYQSTPNVYQEMVLPGIKDDEK